MINNTCDSIRIIYEISTKQGLKTHYSERGKKRQGQIKLNQDSNNQKTFLKKRSIKKTSVV